MREHGEVGHALIKGENKGVQNKSVSPDATLFPAELM